MSDLDEFVAKLVRDGVSRHFEETERLGMVPMFSFSDVAELLKAAGVKAFSAHNGVKLRDVLNTAVAIKLEKLRNTTNPAPQEKNSAPLLSGADCVETTHGAEMNPAPRNTAALPGATSSRQSPLVQGADHG